MTRSRLTAVFTMILTWVWTRPAVAQAVEQPTSAFLQWAVFLGLFAVVWFILYAGAYRVFLRYYSPAHCKFLFWSLFSLYALTWLHLSGYVWFDWGFRYLWARWAALTLAFLWLVWFFIASMRAESVRGH